MLTEAEARALTAEILALATADETHVSITSGRRTNLRFARNSPSTSGERDELHIGITSTFGTRSGSTSINQRDPAALAAAVRTAEELARRAPEDPEHMPALGPQTYAAIPHAFDADTAGGAGEALPRGVATCLRDARERGVVAAGYTEANASAHAIATSAGLFGYRRETGVELSETARTEDATGSGWAASYAPRVVDVDFAAVARIASAKATASAKPRPLEPKSYVTILEPACVLDMVGYFLAGMDARRADEGRSYFAAPGGKTRLGEQLFAEDLDLVTDPADARLPSPPWDGEWLPRGRTAWVERGKVAALAYDRFWAKQRGVAPVPRGGNPTMSGGSGTLEDLIASTERGVLVTSFWYIRSLDPRTMLFTGLTRDGVFWIENGRISHPVQNFRWNESPIAVLKNVIGKSAAAPTYSRNFGAGTVPALKLSGFGFSSVSDAV